MIELKNDPHVLKISEALWQYGDKRKAAIMVGAGYSKNAKKKIENVDDFPSWDELACKIYKELYPDKQNDHNFKLKKISGNNVLKLAQEYESVFGNNELSNLIINNIPDEQYEPGELHEKLLSLPWADIFTTNYDTLLERQAERIFNIKYDIVKTINEIPLKSQPRIIKLHGSLPSTYPFIITEEQYRRYPKDYSPFVNLVQESMIENTFCLIGFSGSDPNFLAWKGWVKDNLGKNAPNIYMIGLFDFNQSEKSYFDKSFIKLIDLSDYFPKDNYNSKKERINIAFNNFFNAIKENKPLDLRKWPILFKE
ncbi:MAG TPA: SIR2 family protein [Ignavibacteria bacterium]